MVTVALRGPLPEKAGEWLLVMEGGGFGARGDAIEESPRL
jgi:hypothetical protein